MVREAVNGEIRPGKLLSTNSRGLCYKPRQHRQIPPIGCLRLPLKRLP
jgi:hypothetical protein